MDDKSFQNEKEGLIDSSKRLSESRPMFKPVLVKKLLADVVSDDESDDQAPSSDESEEDCDDMEGLQPLSDCTENVQPKSAVEKSETDGTVQKQSKIESKSNVGSVECETIKSIETTKTNSASVKVEESKRKSLLDTYLKDSLRISDQVVKQEEKLPSDVSNSALKRKSYIESLDKDKAQSQWQQKSTTAIDQVKHSIVKESSDLNNQYKSYSPDIKRHSSSRSSQAHEDKDRVKQFESHSSVRETQESRPSSSSNLSKTYTSSTSSSSTIGSNTHDDKVPVPSQVQVSQANNPLVSSSSHLTLNASQKITETPMKLPQGSTRPNPCNSHRNIFQTPQSKINHDLSKNPAQTPATIFSHWSQQHMAQTPMNNQSSARESLHTPAANIAQSQSSRQTPRYHVGENKSVRRPLVDSMFSASSHAPPLPKLQEFPHESQPSPPVTSRDNATAQENASEKKSLYSSSQVPKENRNPNPHESIKKESYASSQSKVSQAESRHSIHQKNEMHKVEYAQAHQNNMYAPSRPVERQENYQVRESQSMAPQTTSQESRSMQCSIPQQINIFNPRQHKIITVKNVHYLVLGVLGHGMSCEVVRAQDLTTLEMRAIKCVDISKMEKETVQGCLQEICMLDKLRAPCIVNMYNFEIVGPKIHVVMEIGDTDLSRLLKTMLQEKKQLPLAMILYYWTEMLTAVKHIHEQGVIHSDLKPANFLLVRGRLKLIDFGISSSINADMTSVVKNNTVGTLNYISPEALVDVSAGSPESPNQNKYKLSYKSDIWSLGCILYSLVYNATPFNHIRQTWAKVSAITDPKHKISFPTTTGSQPVPLILIDVMRKCLQRDPKARPTVAELLEISYLQSSTPAVAPSIPPQILFKIKRALSDEEWKQLTEILDRNSQPR